MSDNDKYRNQYYNGRMCLINQVNIFKNKTNAQYDIDLLIENIPTFFNLRSQYSPLGIFKSHCTYTNQFRLVSSTVIAFISTILIGIFYLKWQLDFLSILLYLLIYLAQLYIIPLIAICLYTNLRFVLSKEFKEIFNVEMDRYRQIIDKEIKTILENPEDKQCQEFVFFKSALQEFISNLAFYQEFKTAQNELMKLEEILLNKRNAKCYFFKEAKMLFSIYYAQLLMIEKRSLKYYLLLNSSKLIINNIDNDERRDRLALDMINTGTEIYESEINDINFEMHDIYYKLIFLRALLYKENGCDHLSKTSLSKVVEGFERINNLNEIKYDMPFIQSSKNYIFHSASQHKNFNIMYLISCFSQIK
jgi:hypothetical protein